MTQTKFIEHTCQERFKEKELSQISSEKSTDLSLKKKMNFLQIKSDDMKIIYQTNLK